MGRIKLETFSDFARRGYNVRITCTCGRMEDWHPVRFMEQAHKNRWPQDVAMLERRMRCSWCGKRGVRITPVEHEPSVSNVR